MTQSPSPVDVLLTLPFPTNLVAQLQEVSPRLRVSVHGAQKPEDIPPDVWNRAEVLYTTPQVLPTEEQAPNLKWIQFHYAGIDKMGNAPILKKANLQITTMSGAAVSQMGEYILTMLLSLGHKFPAMTALQKKADWPKDRWERLKPLELRGSTVGIVGYGSIGRQAARLLQAFGATVLATKRNAMAPSDSGYTPEGLGDPDGDFVHRLYPHTALRSMVKECDFVVVTLPLNDETRSLVDASVLAAMKPTAFIVDVSRGGIIEHKALVRALEDHKIAGAGLDVFPEEPLPKDSPLWQMPNVLITPHISGVSSHYDERAASMFSVNLRNYLAGQPLYNTYSLERGY